MPRVTKDAGSRIAPFVDQNFVLSGRGVRVFSVSSGFVWYYTWPEGKGKRQMRCWTTWKRWMSKYAPRRTKKGAKKR